MVTPLVQNKKLVSLHSSKLSEPTPTITRIPFFNANNVVALASLKNNTYKNLFVGTTKGLFWSEDSGLNFKPITLEQQSTQTPWAVVKMLTYEGNGASPEVFVITRSTPSLTKQPLQKLFQIKFNESNADSVQEISFQGSIYATQTYVTTKNHLFIGTNVSLFESDSAENIKLNQIKIPTGQINSIYQGKDGFLFVNSLCKVYRSEIVNPGSSQSYSTVFSLNSSEQDLGDEISFVSQDQNSLYYWMGLIRHENKPILYDSPYGSRFTPVFPPSKNTPVQGGVTKGLFVNSAMWFSTLTNGVLVGGGDPVQVKPTEGVSPDTNVTSLATVTVPSPSFEKNSAVTTLWAGNANGDLYEATNPSFTQFSFKSVTTLKSKSAPHVLISQIFQDPDTSQTYIATSNGLYFLGIYPSKIFVVVIPFPVATGPVATGLSGLTVGLIALGVVLGVGAITGSGAYLFYHSKKSRSLVKTKKH